MTVTLRFTADVDWLTLGPFAAIVATDDGLFSGVTITSAAQGGEPPPGCARCNVLGLDGCGLRHARHGRMFAPDTEAPDA